MSDATNSLNPNTAAAATDPWADASAAPASTDSAASASTDSAASASADPWATTATPAPDASADPWGAASGGDAAGGDWLGAYPERCVAGSTGAFLKPGGSGAA